MECLGTTRLARQRGDSATCGHGRIVVLGRCGFNLAVQGHLDLERCRISLDRRLLIATRLVTHVTHGVSYENR
jgi:hypothetical protein